MAAPSTSTSTSTSTSCSCSLPPAIPLLPPLINPQLPPPLAGHRVACKKIAHLGWGDRPSRRRRSAGTQRVSGVGDGRRRTAGQVMILRVQTSRPAVHPHPDPAPVVEAPAPPAPAPAPAAAAAPNVLAPAQGQGNAAPNVHAPPGVHMRGHGPVGRLLLRLLQALLAAAALAAMASTRGFASVTAFRYLVSAAALQCLWSLAVTILNFYALLVGRSFRSFRAYAILCVGDWISGGLTFSAACGSAAITTFISNDMEACHENHCPSFMAATAMAFLSSFSIATCCLLNLGQVVYKLQRP